MRRFLLFIFPLRNTRTYLLRYRYITGDLAIRRHGAPPRYHSFCRVVHVFAGRQCDHTDRDRVAARHACQGAEMADFVRQRLFFPSGKRSKFTLAQFAPYPISQGPASSVPLKRLAAVLPRSTEFGLTGITSASWRRCSIRALSE